MLRFFNKFARSRNFMLLAFCALLLVGLIAFYIPNTPLDPTGRFSSNAAEDDTVIAKVGSKEIKLKEYRFTLATMAQQFGRGNSLPFSTLKALGMDKQVLDQLISNRLMLDKAEDLNLAGTDRVEESGDDDPEAAVAAVGEGEVFAHRLRTSVGPAQLVGRAKDDVRLLLLREA